MRYRYVLPCVGVVIIVFALYLFLPRSEKGDNIGDFEGWKPTPAEIAAVVGKSGAGVYDDERHRKFAEMFKQRYRDQSYAVGMKFLSDAKIKLMFAATIPRWDMVRVAAQADREAWEIFGKHYQIDIYETYISIRQRKLAEVRFDPKTNRHRAYFDPKFHLEWAPDNPFRPREMPVSMMPPARLRRPIGSPLVPHD